MLASPALPLKRCHCYAAMLLYHAISCYIYHAISCYIYICYALICIASKFDWTFSFFHCMDQLKISWIIFHFSEWRPRRTWDQLGKDSESHILNVEICGDPCRSNMVKLGQNVQCSTYHNISVHWRWWWVWTHFHGLFVMSILYYSCISTFTFIDISGILKQLQVWQHPASFMQNCWSFNRSPSKAGSNSRKTSCE